MMAGLRQCAKNRNGFVLIAFALALLVTLGFVGLSFDIGRMYITQSELQSFCDATAVAAVAKLDGTTPGLHAARDAAAAIVKGYEFGSTPIDSTHATITLQFAQSPATPTSAPDWQSDPDPAGVVMARMTVTAPLKMMLMPVLTRTFGARVSASAAAKQILTGKLNNIFPFTPFWLPPGFGSGPVKDLVNGNTSTVPSAPPDPFGMVPARLGDDPEKYTWQQGGIYTLRGPSSIDTKKDLYDPTDPNKNQMCRDDSTTAAADYRTLNGKSERGYISWDQSKSDIKQTILGNDGDPNGATIGVGDSVVTGCDFCLVNGTAAVEVDAIKDRIALDTEAGQQAHNYREYMNNGNPIGNGERVVVVPISTGLCGDISAGQPACPNYPSGTGFSGPAPSNVVLGFAAFFLLKSDQYVKNSAPPICAEYIGPWTPNQASGNPGSGAFLVKLVQ